MHVRGLHLGHLRELLLRRQHGGRFCRRAAGRRVRRAGMLQDASREVCEVAEGDAQSIGRTRTSARPGPEAHEASAIDAGRAAREQQATALLLGDGPRVSEASRRRGNLHQAEPRCRCLALNVLRPHGGGNAGAGKNRLLQHESRRGRGLAQIPQARREGRAEHLRRKSRLVRTRGEDRARPQRIRLIGAPCRAHSSAAPARLATPARAAAGAEARGRARRRRGGVQENVIEPEHLLRVQQAARVRVQRGGGFNQRHGVNLHEHSAAAAGAAAAAAKAAACV